MICILGDWKEDRISFDKAKEHLINTEKYHQIYGTKDILNIVDLFNILQLEEKQQIDILLHILSYCDTVYMLKGWEYNNDLRMLHDYCANNGYKVIYSKKF